jgi:hypothetical protein
MIRKILVGAVAFVFSCSAFASIQESPAISSGVEFSPLDILIIKDQVASRLNEYADNYSAFLAAPQSHTDPAYITALNNLLDTFSQDITFSVNGPVDITVTSFDELTTIFQELKDYFEKGLSTISNSNIIVKPLGVDDQCRRLASASYTDTEYAVTYYQGPGQTESTVAVSLTVTQGNTLWREEEVSPGCKKWKATNFTLYDQLFYGPVPYFWLRATDGYCQNTYVPAPDPCPLCTNPATFQPVCP